MSTPREINTEQRRFWAGVTYDSAGYPTAPTPAPEPFKFGKPGAGWWMRAIPTTPNEQEK